MDGQESGPIRTSAGGCPYEHVSKPAVMLPVSVCKNKYFLLKFNKLLKIVQYMPF